jgi:hypothetical protein
MNGFIVTTLAIILSFSSVHAVRTKFDNSESTSKLTDDLNTQI